MRKYSVYLYKYNLDGFKKGLKENGINFEDLTDEQITKMLSYALGYCDWSNDSIMKDIIEEMDK